MAADPVLARLAPSAGRRRLAIAVLGGLAVLLIWRGLAVGGPALPRLGLLVSGLATAVVAEALRRATQTALEVTAAGLRDSAGRIIAPLADIVSVDRGMLAFRPSNGFLIRLARPAPRGWAPGLWWRIGRRIGVGGITAPAEAKAMAEALAALVRARDAG